jgi:hypothetical protein
MKTKHFLTIAAVMASFLALEAVAQVPSYRVEFIEIGEQQGMTINFPGGWANPFFDFNPFESASFSGIIKGLSVGTSPNGGYNFVLQEFAGGPASDILNVAWAPTVFQDANSTSFLFNFTSDTEGQTLPLPSTGVTPADGIQLETGAQQSWQVPGMTGIALTVGIQSDAPETVPDGGATIILLGLSSAGLATLRRFRK